MGLLKNLFSKNNNESETPVDTMKRVFNDSDMEVSFNVPDHVKVNSTIYLQDRLKKLVGNSVRLQIVDIKKAKKPTGWTEGIRGDQALVDTKYELYGVLFDPKLEKTGHKIGDTVDCLITKTNKGSVELWIPITPEQLIKEKQEKANTIGINISANMMKIEMTGNEQELGACTVETLPVKEGSKARPVIAVKDKTGNTICEVTGRSSSYKDLEPLIGKPVKYVKIKKRDSQYSEDESYYRLILNIG